MNEHILIPHPALRSYIDQYLFFEIGNPDSWSDTNMTPPGYASLSITAEKSTISIKENNDPAGKYESVTLVGQTTRFKKIFLYDRLKCFFVIFRPWGVYPLLGVHQGECRDACISLSDLLGSSVRLFEEELVEQKHAEDLQQVVEKFFLKRISGSRRQAQKKQLESFRLANIVMRMRSQSHISSISKICQEEGYSMSRLERHMRKIVGISPKQFQRIMRFNMVLQYLKQNKSHGNWSEVAGRFGYYDQTHFIKEFKLFYGKTPAEQSADDRFLSKITAR